MYTYILRSDISMDVGAFQLSTKLLVEFGGKEHQESKHFGSPQL